MPCVVIVITYLFLTLFLFRRSTKTCSRCNYYFTISLFFAFNHIPCKPKQKQINPNFRLLTR